MTLSACPCRHHPFTPVKDLKLTVSHGGVMKEDKATLCVSMEDRPIHGFCLLSVSVFVCEKERSRCFLS